MIAFVWFCTHFHDAGKWLMLITQSTGSNDHKVGKSLQAHKAIHKAATSISSGFLFLLGKFFVYC